MRGGINGAGQFLLPQQPGQLLADRPARDGQSGALLSKDTQGPCHIDALAAGIAAAGKNPVGGAGPQMLHFQCFINSGIEGDGVDHKITSGQIFIPSIAHKWGSCPPKEKPSPE